MGPPEASWYQAPRPDTSEGKATTDDSVGNGDRVDGDDVDGDDESQREGELQEVAALSEQLERSGVADSPTAEVPTAAPAEGASEQEASGMEHLAGQSTGAPTEETAAQVAPLVDTSARSARIYSLKDWAERYCP